MAYTYDEALNEWKKCKTLADFENLIANTSAQVTGPMPVVLICFIAVILMINTLATYLKI